MPLPMGDTLGREAGRVADDIVSEYDKCSSFENR